MVFGLDTAIGPGGGGAIDRREESFIPTPGQTLFVLAATPGDPSDVDVYVNTVKSDSLLSYSVVGNQVTWLDVPFSFDAQDRVEIIYFV